MIYKKHTYNNLGSIGSIIKQIPYSIGSSLSWRIRTHKYIQAAEYFMHNRQWHEAARKWRTVVEKSNPNAVPAGVWVKAGRSYRFLSRLEEAENVLRSGMVIHPVHIELRKEFAEVAVDRGKWSEAARRWQAVVDITGEPESTPDVWLKLGKAHKLRRALKQAETTIQKGLSFYPDNTDLKTEYAEIAMQRERWPEAARRWQAVVDSMDEARVPASIWARLGRAYRNQSNTTDARATLEKGGSYYPEDADLNSELAEMAVVREDWPEAARRWQAVVDSMDEARVPSPVWVKLGRAYQQRFQFDKAREVLEKGLEYAPAHPDLMTEIAETATLREDWPEAARRWQAVVDTRDDVVAGGVWARLIQALRNDARTKHASVDALADNALEAYPGSYDITVERAQAASDRKDWATAAEWWWEAANIYSERTPASVWVKLSQALRYDHKPRKAETTIRSILDAYPDELDFQRELAETLMEQKRWPEASIVLKNILEGIGYTDSMYEKLGRERMMYSALKRLENPEDYKHTITAYQSARQQTPPSIVIYTAISGNYDSLKLPHFLDARFDYIVFTDTPAADTGVFHVRPLPYWHEDETRAARFVKTHPHLLLSEYDVAIWIDANIMILDDVYPLVEEFLHSEKPIAAIPHPLRDSIHEEAEECIERGKDKPSVIRQQISRYETEKLERAKLIESNFMMFNIHEESVAPMLDTWWAEINTHSRRDQLSLNYALACHDMEYHKLTEPPDSIRNHPRFALTPHTLDSKPVTELLHRIADAFHDPYDDPSYATVKATRIPKQDRRIDIVVCVHNALENVKSCLQSVASYRDYNQRLIIVDDGSGVETADYLNAFARDNEDWTRLLRNEQPGGYSHAANQGLRESDGELVILLNSDVIVTRDWTDKMLDAVDMIPHVGIVGPMSSAASYQSLPRHRRQTAHQTATNNLPEGTSIEDMNRKCEEWSYAHLFPIVPLIHGSCFGITREAIDTIGMFDETAFPRGYGEETDYCFRAADAGLQQIIATNTYVFHAKSKSYEDEERIHLTQEGSDKLKQAYGEKRFYQAVRTMDFHPLLESMRRQCKTWYIDVTGDW